MTSSANEPVTSPTLLVALADWQNEEAWKAFTQGYIPFIDDCARRCGLQDADVTEVRSRVLVSLVNAIRSFSYNSARRFRGYLKVCVQNTAKSYFKELNLRPGSVGYGGDLQRAVQDTESVDAVFEELASELETRTRNDLELLWRILETAKGRLAPTTWLAFELTRLKGISSEEAAKELQISVATLYVYRGRVADMLREIATEFGLGDE